MITSVSRLTGVAAVLILMATAQTAPQNGEWRTYGGDKTWDRYSPLDQINRNNVKDLTILWSRPAVDPSLRSRFPDALASNYFRGTPIMIGGVLYAPNGIGLIEAFDAATGQTKWVQQPVEPTLREAAGESTRGVSYWHNGSDERIVSVRGQYLYAMDAKTGLPCRDFGENGRISLKRDTPDNAPYFGWAGPFVVNDVIVVGGNGGGKAGEGYGDGGFDPKARPEDIRGYDVHSGALLWTFHVLPRKGEPGYDTWGKGSAEYVGNMDAWASLTADEQLGYVYIPLTAPTASYYGGHRPGKNLYSDSLVCLDVKTGKVVWYYQLIHHDLWEYDAATPPVLGDITVDGRRIKAVIASNKTGFLYVFDRVTGKPVWPIEERPVPRSNVPGEEPWPTQPFPTKPPAIDRQGFSESDLIDFTPELHKKALEIASHFVMGPLFTPPTIIDDSPGGKKGTLILPSDWGAANWNTGAFDPETGMYYAVSMTLPAVLGLRRNPDPNNPMLYGEGPPPARPHRPGEAQPQRQEFQELSVDGLPLVKPPYGRITAYDMNKGTKEWMVPNGDGPRNHPFLKDLHLPPLGNTGRPVALVTKTLLFVGDSSNAVMGGAGIGGAAKFRAYDKANGQLIAELDLPVGATGGPMTYMANSKQLIVVPIGGRGYGAGWVAFGLPASKNEPGVYTITQANLGQSAYRAKCLGCHGADLSGGEHAPPLEGRRFWAQFDQESARTLYSRIISTMPPDEPGSLASKDVIDIVSYLLQANGLPPGETAIESPDELNVVRLKKPN
ncbi:MAG TPA: PQQ-binding-like beta-propeller repeat protein [Bryobacteraceae bacterium]|nr:PQQ-binding-like beta-propeller repeat protein [Bryobacteraceae bacterium]